jgi:DNA-binding MarR family transcriptional regulator
MGLVRYANDVWLSDRQTPEDALAEVAGLAVSGSPRPGGAGSRLAGGPETSALAHEARIAVMRMARRLRRERADTSLTLTQLSALATVERHGPLTPGELAEHERVQPPSMTRVIGGLEERGLLTRTPHPTDGRQALVSVTPAAVALLAVERAARERWLSAALQALSADERSTLAAAVPVLERLARG